MFHCPESDGYNLQCFQRAIVYDSGVASMRDVLQGFRVATRSIGCRVERG